MEAPVVEDCLSRVAESNSWRLSWAVVHGPCRNILQCVYSKRVQIPNVSTIKILQQPYSHNIFLILESLPCSSSPSKEWHMRIDRWGESIAYRNIIGRSERNQDHQTKTDYHQRPFAHTTHQDYPTAWSNTNWVIASCLQLCKGPYEDVCDKNQLWINTCTTCQWEEEVNPAKCTQ